MGKKAKVWLGLLIAFLVIRIAYGAMFGNSFMGLFLNIVLNPLFWWFLIMFIYRLNNPNKKGEINEAENDAGSMSN